MKKVSQEGIIWEAKKRCKRNHYNHKHVQIVDCAVGEDYIHLSVVISLKRNVSSFIGYLKGKSTLMIYYRRPELQGK